MSHYTVEVSACRTVLTSLPIVDEARGHSLGECEKHAPIGERHEGSPGSVDSEVTNDVPRDESPKACGEANKATE